MRLGFLKSPPVLIAAPVLAATCLLEIFHVPVFQKLESQTYDWRVKLAHEYPLTRVPTATNLGFVDINDNSIGAVMSGLGFGLYWPRQVYGRALDELTRQGARAAAFDVLFHERRADQPPIKLTNGMDESSDDFFVDKIQEAGNVILASEQTVMPASYFFTAAWSVGSIDTDKDADGVLRRETPYVDCTNWHSKILDIAYTNGYDLTKTRITPTVIVLSGHGEERTFSLDADGFINQGILHLKPFERYRAWSMGIILAARELGLDLDKACIDSARQQLILPGTNGVSRVIPLDRDGKFYINWSMTRSAPALAREPFEKLLADNIRRARGEAIPNTWSNKLVIFGSTATGNDLSDRGVTPLANDTFLVSKHWNVANSIITGQFIHFTPLAVNLALIVLAGSFCGWVTWISVKPLAGTGMVAAFGAVYLAGAAWVFDVWRICAPIVLPLVCAGAVTHLMALAYRVRTEQHERRRTKAMFQRLVSPDIVNELLDNPSLSLSSRREVTVYFADIRGFTELSDIIQQRAEAHVSGHKMDARAAELYYDEQARFLLNTVSLYLGTITNAIKSHRGTLDKYIGDCVMAFWGAPTGNPSHALDAVRAAIDAQRALASLNRQREVQNARRAEENVERAQAGLLPHEMLPILSMGSGINTGIAIAGLMGSDNHIVNYTVFGREVNLASRLEGVSGHGRIIIGHATYRALEAQEPALAKACLELPPKPVKGFRDVVRIFEVPWDGAAGPGGTAFIEKTSFIQRAASSRQANLEDAAKRKKELSKE